MAFVGQFVPVWQTSGPSQACPLHRGVVRTRAVMQNSAQNAAQDSSQNDTPQTQPIIPPVPSLVDDKAAGDKSSPFSKLEVPSGKIRARRQVRGGGRKLVGNIRTQGARFVKLPPNPPGLRVVSGTAKGRLVSSPSVYLRPMMGKVREALFSMLFSFGAMRSDATVLDLFSGTGSIAIEALSRGMASAVLVDYAKECTEAARENLAHCGFGERGQAVCARVEEFMADGASFNGGKHYDLITITPPYEEVDYNMLMQKLVESNCVGEGTFVVVEYPVELKTFPATIGHRLLGVRNRKYGRTMLAVYACQPDVNIDLRPDEFMLKRRKR